MTDPFKFKHFIVEHKYAPMKVNTDGVLLGAWVDIQNATRVLDVGTGCGIIALMLAQRTNDTLIDAIEIDADASIEATFNGASSPWKNRLFFYNISVQDFFRDKSNSYNLIVSNPPFFSNALLSPTNKKNIARHHQELCYETLVSISSKNLQLGGRLCVVIPYNSTDEFVCIAERFNLFLIRRNDVTSKDGKSPFRSLLEFSNIKKDCVNSELLMEHTGAEGYTAEYRKLCRDFYLKF